MVQSEYPQPSGPGAAHDGLGRMGRSEWLALVVVSAIYLLTQVGLEQRGFWITDNAAKFLQTEAFLAHAGLDFSLDWPGVELDPTFELNPLPAPFAKVADGRLQSSYPPAFALVSAPFYRVFGFAGLRALPIASGILLLAALAVLGREVGLSSGARAAGILVAGLATPVWFYSQVFWEHTLVLALAILGIGAVTRGLGRASERFLLHGALALAAATWFRADTLLLAAAVGLSILLAEETSRIRSTSLYSAALAVGLVPLLLLQWYSLGTPLGYHVSGQFSEVSAASWLAERAGVAFRLFCANGMPPLAGVALSAPYLLALVVRPRLPPPLFRLALPALGFFGSLYGLLAVVPLADGATPILHLLQSNSLFPAAPFAILALVRPPSDLSRGGEAAATRIGLIVSTVCLAYAAAAPPVSTQGVHWGNRFLLIAYPLMALLAVRNIAIWYRTSEAGFPRRLAMASVLAVSCAAQLLSVVLLEQRRAFSARLNAAVEERPEAVVVTDVWWAPHELFSVFRSKAIFLVSNTEQAERIAQRAAGAGAHRLLYVTRPGRGGPAAQLIDDPLGHFSLELVPVELHPPSSGSPTKAGSGNPGAEGSFLPGPQ